MLPAMNWDCWVETLAPSELTMRGSSRKAADSHAFAIAIARSTGRSHGWKRSRSRLDREISAGSASPAASSAAVKRAIESAAATVSRIAFGARSEELA